MSDETAARLLLMETRLREVLQVLQGNAQATVGAFKLVDERYDDLHVHVRALQFLVSDLYTGTVRSIPEHEEILKLRDENKQNPDYDPYVYLEQYNIQVPRTKDASIDFEYYHQLARQRLAERERTDETK